MKFKKLLLVLLFFPIVLVNASISLDMLEPNGNQFLSIPNANWDGNHSIDFTVQSTDSNYLRLQAYLSKTKLSFENLLFDYNLSAVAENPSMDLNCGASSIDFSSVRSCHLDWNILDPVFVGDGNYFVDLNVSHYNQFAEPELLTDGFEDGDYSSNPDWTIINNGTVSVQSVIKKNGVFAAKLETGGATSDYGIERPVSGSANSWNVWVNGTNFSGGHGISFFLANNSSDVTPRKYIRLQVNVWGGVIRFSDFEGQLYDSGIALSDNAWYRLNIVYDSNETAWTGIVYDAEDKIVATNTFPAFSGFEIKYVSALVQYVNPSLTGDVYLDDISYGYGQTTGLDINAVTSSDSSFQIDTNKPVTTWNGTDYWQADANIQLVCLDENGSGCFTTQYRMDSDSSSRIELGEWMVFDGNIFFNQDGNWALEFNSTDNAENREETVQKFVLIDEEQAPPSRKEIRFFPSAPPNFSQKTAGIDYNFAPFADAVRATENSIPIAGWDENHLAVVGSQDNCKKTKTVFVSLSLDAFSASDQNTLLADSINWLLEETPPALCPATKIPKPR